LPDYSEISEEVWRMWAEIEVGLMHGEVLQNSCLLTNYRNFFIVI
jgi:hypothetical protein